MKSPEKIPCPFCGSKDSTYAIHYHTNKKTSVYCKECGAEGPSAIEYFNTTIDSQVLADILWNHALQISKNGCPCCGKKKWFLFMGDNGNLELLENDIDYEIAVDMVMKYLDKDEEYDDIDDIDDIVVDLCLSCGTTISNYALADGAYLEEEF